jgi:hypothetical protein
VAEARVSAAVACPVKMIGVKNFAPTVFFPLWMARAFVRAQDERRAVRIILR